MTSARFAAHASVAALALGLTACGGAGGGTGSTPPPWGGGTPTPTPTPLPPTGTNDDLLPTLASENFVNLAATGTASYPTSGANGTTSSGAATVTFSYSATSGTYTVSTSGRSQSFSGAHKDLALSNAQITVYTRSAGSTTDSLTLSNPGTGGILTYRYVGSGYWQRTVQGSSTVTATLDGFVYGVVTPNAQVPRTGSGRFLVDLQGVHAYPDGVTSMIGDGEVLVNFGSGAMIVDGYGDEYRVDGSWNGNFYWDGTATLSASSNSFTGQMQAGAVSGLSLNGMFFGPNAAEVGAVFRGSGNGTSIVGTLIGRLDPP